MKYFKKAGFIKVTMVTMILMFFTAYNSIPKAAAQSASEEAARIAAEAAAKAKALREKAEEDRKLEEEKKKAADELARQQAAAAAEEARKKAQAAADLIWKSFDTDMVLIQGGTFIMGCTAEQKGDCNNNETPTQEVTLHDFYIGKYEVTQAQWQKVMGNNPSEFKGDNLPVTNVSWNDSQEFIKRLNALTVDNYRLPTEAEWEYAARGGSLSKGYKYSGSNYVGDVAWYRENSGIKTHPVGTKKPNELSIHDMSGNVNELVQDGRWEYSGVPLTNPQGTFSGSGRVIRGGNYGGIARYERVSARSYIAPAERWPNLGFRLARSSN